MKVLLDIQDEKPAFMLQLLKNFSFVKVKTLTSEKAKIIEEISSSISEFNRIKNSKKQSRPVEQLISEL